MDPKEILKYCMEKGVLIDSGALGLLKEAGDSQSAKLIIEKLKNNIQQKVITKTFFEQNKKEILRIFSELPSENQRRLEGLKIKLGLEIEISRVSELENKKEKESRKSVYVKSFKMSPDKKIEADDFVKNFRSRFNELRNILQERVELENLVSIDKLSRLQKSSIIGMVYDKRITKNKNILLEVEDLTGTTRVLINQNKPDLYKQVEEISLDSVLGFSGFGDKEIFFANNIVLPDVAIFEKKRSPVEEYALFLGDVHYGSKLFFKEKFKKFIDYLNGKTSCSEDINRIKYLFIVGDLVAGVGVYPSQHLELDVADLEAQFRGVADMLKEIRDDITIIISPGNHDGVRLLEPQPFLDERYAWPLYNLKNVIFTNNPAVLNIGSKENFPGFKVLTYHGFSYPYYANNVPVLIKGGLNSPDKIMAYLLKHRHLAPTYSSTQYVPYEEDFLLIKEVPDIFVSGHTHKCSVSSYKGVLLVSSAAWEDETNFQKKTGNKPDFCKVPMINLKTRAVKILDFE